MKDTIDSKMADNNQDAWHEESQLPKELIEALKDLPKEEQVKISQIIYSQHLTAFKGPLPPPSILKEYQEIIPNSPERFLQLVEREQAHTLSCEKSIIINQILQNWVGLIIGAGLVIFLCLMAYDLATKGYDLLAGIIFSTTLVAVAAIFVLRKLPSKTTKESHTNNKS